MRSTGTITIRLPLEVIEKIPNVHQSKGEWVRERVLEIVYKLEKGEKGALQEQ